MRLSTLLLLVSLSGFAAEHRRPLMPLLFIPNHGQATPEAQFMVKGVGITALFERSELVYTAHGGSVRVRFAGASGPAAVEGVSRIAGEVNFLSGREEEWQRGIPVYSGVAYREVYPGIDLMFSGAGRHLKSEFLVAPGVDPSQIGLEFVGADHVWVRDDGSLAVRFGRRQVHEDPPLIYQLRDGEQLRVDGSFVVTGNVARFSIGAYDKELPLVIDPVVYATLLSGSGADAALSMAVDNTRAAYVTGFTSSFDLATINPAQSSTAGGNEAFVAKLNPAGNALVYCTFIGGRGDDRAAAIAVDSTGAAYIAGATTSPNFPTRAALQPTFGGVKDAFLLKLNAAGNALVYGTYLGGTASDSAQGIAVDSAGNAYVAGDTASPGFPAAGFQTTLRGGVDAFAAKIAADGSRLVYSTFLGGAADEHAAAIAVDAYGQASVAGSTYSANYPTANAHQGALAGGHDTFLTKLAASGGSLVFSTYFGGSGGYVGSAEEARAVALDAQGNVYLAGQTSSANFPVRNAAQTANAGWQDAFAAKFTSGGTLVYSTYIGGANIDVADTVAVDGSGSAHVGGATTSANLMSALGVQGPATGLYDGFIVKLTPAGNAASAMVLLGGAGSDNVSAVALDAAGSVYAAGYTLSPTFPLPNGTVAINAGNYGAFIAKMVLSSAAVAVTVTPAAATLSPSQTQQFAAAVTNTANTAVSWSLTPAVGTISATGLYTAPATVSSTQTVTVKATSVADPTKSATATVTVTAGTALQNLASGGAAAQSSTLAPGTAASKATDGNTDGSFLNGSVSCTNADPYAWWQVDLGISADISSLVIWNRTDGSMSRLNDYWVFVSDIPFSTSDTPVTLQSRAGTWSSHQIGYPNPSTTIPVNYQGRYLRIQLATQNHLQIAEVLVYGIPVVNLAATGVASQSSTYHGGTAAAKAIDGNTDGDFSRGSVSCTNGDLYAWWQVDLGSSANIRSVAIWNRTDGSMARLNDYWIFVSDAPFLASDTPATLQSRAGTWSSRRTGYPNPVAAIPVSARGRYVRVQLAAADYLQIAEVRVFGPAANLAGSGVASQSSSYAPATTATKAADGNTDGNLINGSVSCTNSDPYAWWQVDLGTSASISSVAIWNRTDGSMSRLAKYWVFVSDSPFLASETPASLQNRPGTWSSFQSGFPNPVVTVPVNTRGRFVRIQLTTWDHLQIAEVQILGSGTANLARGGTALQSSVYDPNTVAAKAIDGSTDGVFGNGSVSCTNSNSYAWWQVDLGTSAQIDSVAIWNRTDGSMARLNDYWIFVSDSPFQSSDTPATLQSRAGTWASHRTGYPNPVTSILVDARGRYVRVQLNTTEYLQIAEVQVFGTRN